MTLPDIELYSAEVLLVQLDMALKLLSSEPLEVRAGVCRLLASGSKALSVEGEDVALESGEAWHASLDAMPCSGPIVTVAMYLQVPGSRDVINVLKALAAASLPDLTTTLGGARPHL